MNTAKKLIANELLPVYQTTSTGEKVIDARELHEFLEVASRFNDWIERQLKKYGFIEGEDFYSFLSKTQNGGRPRTEYLLKLDMAKELCMVENNEQGRKARRYFIEVEKRMQNIINLPPVQPVPVATPEALLPIDFERINKLLQMLRMAYREELFDVRLESEMRKQIAKLIAGDLITPTKTGGRQLPLTHSSGWYSAGDIAKILNVSPQKIASMVTKHGLRTEEYCNTVNAGSSPSTWGKRTLYNEKCKNKLIEIALEEKKKW